MKRSTKRLITGEVATAMIVIAVIHPFYKLGINFDLLIMGVVLLTAVHYE